MISNNSSRFHKAKIIESFHPSGIDPAPVTVSGDEAVKLETL
jgi:hypothetical protein